MNANPQALGGGYGFMVPARAIMPVTDPVWLGADPLIQAQLWAVAEREVLLAKRSSLMLGDSTEGGKLLPIHPLTRFARRANIDYTKPPRGRKPYSPMGRANESNAPLLATGHKARAVVLLRAAATPAGIWGYWDRDPHTGKYWGEILYKHRTGFQQTFYGPNRRKAAAFNPRNPGFKPRKVPKGRVAQIPQRDVIGLPPQWTARVKAKVDAKWRQLRPQAERLTRMDPRQPTPPASNIGLTGRYQYASTPALGARGFRTPTGGQQLAGRIASAVTRLVRGLFGR